MKIKKSTYSQLLEYEEKGIVCSLSNIVKSKRTKLNEELNHYARNQIPGFVGVFQEDEGEILLSHLNTRMAEQGVDVPTLSYPITEGVDHHFVPFTDHLTLIVVVVDEYYGGGDYSQYVDVGYFVIDESTTAKDVDVLIDWLCEKGFVKRKR